MSELLDPGGILEMLLGDASRIIWDRQRTLNVALNKKQETRMEMKTVMLDYDWIGDGCQ